MFNLVVFFADERRCASLLRKIRWKRYITCIYCHSENIKKNGRYRSYQKYYLPGRPERKIISLRDIEFWKTTHDRGLKAWKGRSTLEKDTPIIICVHQRGEGMTYFDVHNTKQPLISNIRRLILSSSHESLY